MSIRHSVYICMSIISNRGTHRNGQYRMVCLVLIRYTHDAPTLTFVNSEKAGTECNKSVVGNVLLIEETISFSSIESEQVYETAIRQRRHISHGIQSGD